MLQREMQQLKQVLERSEDEDQLLELVEEAAEPQVESERERE